MYTIELVLKGNPALLAVQRKEEEAATQLYRQVVEAVKRGETGLLELSCEKTERKVAVSVGEISAVQLTPKAGTVSPAGNRPGFFAQLDND
jgi:hypothetical protein